ncbi:hypothetical protein PM082_018425 [Marasmius tenuissimus]|nr:hypothetical protein PM082_018425 [Marasmius tenuissimus]
MSSNDTQTSGNSKNTASTPEVNEATVTNNNGVRPRPNSQMYRIQTQLVGISHGPNDALPAPQQPTTTPRKSRRRLRKSTSMVVFTSIKSSAKHLDQLESMHYALAKEVRVNDEQARRDLQAIARTAQDAPLLANEAANTGLMNLARDPIITSLVNTSRSLQASLN